ncbi:AI-2E family transporter [Propylenella binzhouense]|uniref:AI-2E family transporter n=1 Tax=Propylenella binzhouense TaxID=2555902 RepID=A0A964WUM2_9HYPH|nr:AI-2E family transporter [Propylenella binzhouense]MYZ49221.1 AI-2E family transporter [Propylenella binzhouense]
MATGQDGRSVNELISQAQPAPQEEHEQVEVVAETPHAAPRWATIGIFFILLAGLFYLAKGFVLPVALAFLFALVLSPIVRFLARRGIPPFLSAALLVGAGVIGIGFGAYMLSGPVGDWMGQAPYIGYRLEDKLRTLREPVQQIEQASEQVDKLTKARDPDPNADVQEVVIRQPGLASAAAEGFVDVVAKGIFAIVLLLFLLASGDLFYLKLVRTMPSLTDKKRAMRIAHDIERELSRYLLTISAINSGLGVAVGTCLWLVNMPNPALWGALATIANFIPYVGSLTGVSIVAVAALLHFPTLEPALYPPALYLLCTAIEGQFLTPMIVGRRLEMNAVAIFLAVAFWGWLWGVVGMLIAVPLMVGIKIFCSHIEGLQSLADFLSVEPRKIEEEED